MLVGILLLIDRWGFALLLATLFLVCAGISAYVAWRLYPVVWICAGLFLGLGVIFEMQFYGMGSKSLFGSILMTTTGAGLIGYALMRPLPIMLVPIGASFGLAGALYAAGVAHLRYEVAASLLLAAIGIGVFGWLVYRPQLWRIGSNREVRFAPSGLEPAQLKIRVPAPPDSDSKAPVTVGGERC